MNEAELSVVITLTSGRKDVLRRCLRSLHEQGDSPVLEIWVPYDPPIASVAELAPEFPAVHFFEVALRTDAARAGHEREHHDLLRREGLRRATAPVVALLEDRVVCEPEWSRAALEEVSATPGAGAVGGSVDFGAGNRLLHALWLSDFGRFARPVREGPAQWVSDVNVAYSRSALEAVRATWADSYREPEVHDALRRKGFAPRLSNRLRTHQHHEAVPLGSALAERIAWGRSFAFTRVRGRGLLARLPLALATPLLPPLLCFRHLRGAHRRGRTPVRAWASLHWLVALESAWALGECLGYLSGRATARGGS